VNTTVSFGAAGRAFRVSSNKANPVDDGYSIKGACPNDVPRPSGRLTRSLRRTSADAGATGRLDHARASMMATFGDLVPDDDDPERPFRVLCRG